MQLCKKKMQYSTSEVTEYREKEKTELEKISFLEMQASILKASAGK